MEPQSRILDVGVRLRVRQWPGDGVGFVLLHGLASNARTWDEVASRLAAAGHPVAAVDQRGHGCSDKPAVGYDFDTVANDLCRVCDALGWEAPVVVGQSWGANVVLAFGARHPGRAHGLGFVDGGTLELATYFGGDWDEIARRLRPPDFTGRRWSDLRNGIRAAHPDWSEAGVEGTLANFERLPDGTVRPWLSLERHMTILEALYHQRPRDLYPRIADPVVVCLADEPRRGGRNRDDEAAAARAGLARLSVHRFARTDHDIHLHRPGELARVFLDELASGVWADP